MKREEIKNKVEELIENTLGIDKSEIFVDASLQNDLGADSLDAVELIMESEKEFNIRIEDKDAENVGTVSDLIDLIEKTINA